MNKKNKKCFYCIVISFFLLFVSCAKSKVRPELLQQVESNAKSEKLNIEIASRLNRLRKSNSIEDYKIGPGDLLEIAVFQVEDFNDVIRVSSSGYIKLPLIGAISTSSLTVSELEEDISKRLEKYIEEPSVSIFISEYRSQQITVLGAVKNPQIFSVTQKKYLLEMISMAGGLSEYAESVCHVQKYYDDGTSEKIVIDLDKLLLEGNMELNVPLSAGDIVYIPQKGIFFIDGAVHSPGSYLIEGKMTISQAIIIAKGLKYQAARSNVEIYRDKGNNTKEYLKVDYNAVLDKEQPDILIKDRDIIFVHNSRIKSILSGIGNFLKEIFSIGVGYRAEI